MTREEAIKEIRNVFVEDFAGEIIKALKQEDTCEMTVEEYRQRMIQAFYNANCVELIFACVFPTEKEFKHLEWYLKNRYKKEPCEDCISRQALITSLQGHRNFFVNSYGTYKHMAPKDKVRIDEIDNCIARIVNAPSVTPQYTDAEIQKMQELEQSEIEKAYGLGKAEMQPNEDVISRQDTLAEFKRVYFDNDAVIRCAELVLGGMPSVTPQPNTGRWILSGGYWRCSECKEKALLKLDKVGVGCREYIPIKSNYCPNCGRKMMQEVEDGNK